MIPHETRIEARRLFFAEHLTMNLIAEKLGIHHDTVKQAIEVNKFHPRAVFRDSNSDPYISFITKTLEDIPKLTSTRLHQMLFDRGFRGSVQQLRRRVRLIRPKIVRAFLPQTMFPGEQAQVDWAHFGTMQVGRAVRKLSLFIMVLAFSRMIFARFVFEQTIDNFLACHVRAFRALGGIARVQRYDNLRAAVAERFGSAVRYNPALLEMAGHYCFRPSACNPFSGNEKGRVERQVRYVRDNFWPGRYFRTIDDANRQLADWLDHVANERPWVEDRQRKVKEIWEEEKPRLLPLPEHDFSVNVRRPVSSSKMPFIRFDLNDYSIPYKLVRRPLSLIPSEDEVKILDGADEVARHKRSYDRGQRIKSEEHFAGLYDIKPGAKTSDAKAFLVKLIPEAEKLFEMMIEQGVPLGKSTKHLIELVEEHGTQSVREAVKQAIKKGYARTTFIAATCQALAQHRKTAPEVPLILPDRDELKQITVTHHALEGYDGLVTETGGEERSQVKEGEDHDNG